MQVPCFNQATVNFFFLIYLSKSAGDVKTVGISGDS